jgi:hypothetical protein
MVETPVALPPAPVLSAVKVSEVAVGFEAVTEALARTVREEYVMPDPAPKLMAASRLARVFATLPFWSIRTVSAGAPATELAKV